MRSSTVLLHFGLGLLSSLIVAANSLHGVSDDLPVYSTLDYAFTLASTQPDGAHVVLNGDGTPVVTYDRRSSTQFRLTDGNLTAVASKLTAIYGPVGLPLPPLLIPVLLKKDPPPDAILPFLAVHSNRQGKGSDPLTLTAVGEGLVIRIPFGVQNRIYVKPEGNIEPTEHIVLEIQRVKTAATDCHDGHDGQELLSQHYGL